MINKETIIGDLNDICQQTNSQWICCKDIYTTDIMADEDKFVKVFREAGFLKKDILLRNIATLEYGGGLRFNYKDVIGSGYIFSVDEKYKAPLVFAGFETNFDQTTIYHECAHLYQRKHNFFSKKTIPDAKYRKYLKEVHANTFASMIMLLRADDILTFKQQQLYCLATDINTFNKKSKKSIFYISLPIIIELLKQVRKQGRENTYNKFSQNGKLDFEKIALYTAELVNKHAYTSSEFYKINNNMSLPSYDRLKQKAKTWHILGERYIREQLKKQQEQKDIYKHISEQRTLNSSKKIQPLPEIDEKSKTINAICSIDVLNTQLSQDFGIFTNLNDIVSKNLFCLRDISDEQERKKASEICDNIAEIYQKWRKNQFFKKLFSKINHPDTRDSVWALKYKKEREILQQIQTSKQYIKT